MNKLLEKWKRFSRTHVLDVIAGPSLAIAVGVPLLVILIFAAIVVAAVILIARAVREKKARAAAAEPPEAVPAAPAAPDAKPADENPAETVLCAAGPEETDER